MPNRQLTSNGVAWAYLKLEFGESGEKVGPGEREVPMSVGGPQAVTPRPCADGKSRLAA